jgi:hypothetical protein
MSTIKERNKIIADLEKTFALALENNDFKSALQAKQTIGKIQGFIDAKKNKTDGLCLLELSQDDIDSLIKDAEMIRYDKTS